MKILEPQTLTGLFNSNVGTKPIGWEERSHQGLMQETHLPSHEESWAAGSREGAHKHRHGLSTEPLKRDFREQFQSHLIIARKC